MENQTKTNLKKATPGFSLTELIIVIVLIGIFGAMAMTRTRSGLTTIQVQIAIDQITTDIDYSKSMAFARHDTITLVFSTTLEQYTIYNGPDGSRSAITDFPNSTNGVISFDQSDFIEVDITSANFGGSSELQFLPLGDAKSGGSIVLNSKTISVAPVTGTWSVN
ncbi:MAG TPA: prepilin-type N-terminal cleavage/methylation domain-containing protein [Candidatus Marinimicrobia bacterium]|nr:prepilin-type N-terminal cleavage/methylation domain-containing protein [Candidatus Neomarinimicrobiota bacterium]